MVYELSKEKLTSMLRNLKIYNDLNNRKLKQKMNSKDNVKKSKFML